MKTYPKLAKTNKAWRSCAQKTLRPEKTTHFDGRDSKKHKSSTKKTPIGKADERAEAEKATRPNKTNPLPEPAPVLRAPVLREPAPDERAEAEKATRPNKTNPLPEPAPVLRKYYLG